MIDAPRLLPTGHMARRLRVSVKWLAEEAKAGRVPALAAGKVFLFAPEAVEQVLVERAASAPEPQTGEGHIDA